MKSWLQKTTTQWQPLQGSPAFGRLALITALLVILVGSIPVIQSQAAVGFLPQLTRYPYLTDVSSNHVIVNFATTQVTNSTASVKYGLSSGKTCTLSNQVTASSAKGFTVQNSDGTTTPESQWALSLTGLGSEVQYCYRVFFNMGSGDQDLLGPDPNLLFTTLPLAGFNRPLKFIVFGDWGEVDGTTGANPHMQAIISLMSQQGAQFVLTVGDNTYNTPSLAVPIPDQTIYGDLYHQEPGKSAVFGPNFWKVAGASLPIFPGLGNHIISAVGSSTHPDLMNFPQVNSVAASNGISAVQSYPPTSYGSNQVNYPTLYYAFSTGLARFYVLDAAWGNTNTGTGTLYDNDYESHWTATSPEYQWLKADLAAHPDQIKFAIFHFPLYSDGPELSDTRLQGSTSLEGLLTQYGVQFGFSGHSHIYERNITKGGLTTYITGGGGSDLVPVGPCNSYDIYGIGWSYTKPGGSKCGSAPVPDVIEKVFHFLLITVNGPTVTITPINELNQKFDEQVYNLNITLPVITNLYLPMALR